MACSRALSRLADEKVKLLFEISHVDPLSLPEECPLRSSRSLYADQEAHKKQSKPNTWQCGYCGKVFKGEKYMDRHMDNKHSDMLHPNGYCLAELCGVLGCGMTVSLCDRADVLRYRCASIVHKCFPPDQGKAADELHNFFLTKVCDGLICNRHGQLEGFIHDNWKGRSRAGGAVVTVMAIVALVLYYGFLWCTRGDTSTKQDLRRFKKATAKKLD